MQLFFSDNINNQFTLSSEERKHIIKVLRKKEAGRGETDKHNKFFNSSKLSSGKFTNAEAIGRCFENLIDPIGPRSWFCLEKIMVQLTFGTSEISQDIDIFDASLAPLFIISLLSNVRCNENSRVGFPCSTSRIYLTLN